MDDNDYDKIKEGDRLRVPNIREQIERGETTIRIFLNGQQIPTKLDVSPRQREMLLAGGILNQARR
jgi:aconitate hydratase